MNKTYLEDPNLTCRDVSKLVPELITILSTFLSTLASAGITMKVIETFRTQDRQNMLLRKGASKIKHSKHQDCKAVDLIPIDSRGKLLWDFPIKSWELVGELAVKSGLIWGGNWKTFKDRVHFQLGE